MAKERIAESLISKPRIILNEKILNVLVAKDDDKYCAYCPELDLVIAADSTSDVLQSIIEEIREYAEEYMNDVEVYSRSPNRSHHLPYIETIQSCEDDWELMTLLEVRYGNLQL